MKRGSDSGLLKRWTKRYAVFCGDKNNKYYGNFLYFHKQPTSM